MLCVGLAEPPKRGQTLTIDAKTPDANENQGADADLPDILYRCTSCMYVYPLQQSPRKDGELTCAHCGEAFELSEELLADLEVGA